jgi:ADP-heptose:LPS heptosyltransferase
MKSHDSERENSPSATVLALFPGALGDFVCFLPALQALSERGKVDLLLARSEYAALAPPNVTTRSLERYEISRLFVAGSEGDEAIRRFFAPYGWVYSWMGSGEEGFVRRLSAASAGTVKLFPFRSSDSRMHMSDYYLTCVAEPVSGTMPAAVRLQPEDILWAEEFVQRRGCAEEKILAVAPGSGAREKNWPVEFFLEVSRWWRCETGGQALVLYGPAEEERLGDQTRWDGAIQVRGLSLGKVAALLSRCDLYLGNDSGLTHLAGALGIETIALFGPTDAAEWAPRGRSVTVVNWQVECSPCSSSAMKRCAHRKCLTALRPDTVTGLIRRLVFPSRMVETPRPPIGVGGRFHAKQKFVMPAEAGIHGGGGAGHEAKKRLDSRLRGNDGMGR